MRNGRRKNSGEFVPMALVGVSVLLGILIVVEVTSFFAATAKAGSVLAKATTVGDPASKEIDKQLADARAVADKLKKSNLFAPPAPKENPVREVAGIMGDEALINGTWHKVGASIGDAKIVAIEPTRVIVSWNGQERPFIPITAAGAGPSGGPGGGRGGGPGRGPDMVVVASQQTGGRNQGQDMGGMPFGDRGGMRGQFQNMSEAERQAFRDQMRMQFGDRGGDFGGRRGGGGDGGGFGGRGGGGGGRGGRGGG